MRLITAAILIVFFTSFGTAQDFDAISIGIHTHRKPTTVQIIFEHGVYALKADGVNKATLRSGDRVSFRVSNKHVEVSFPGRVLGTFGNVELAVIEGEGVFRLYILSPDRFEAVYDDNLEVSASRGTLKLINRVGLEKYVAGVVEAETGKEKDLEFYKVQAIISRTYALSNRNRFLAEGYNLNDRVDCQVYHGKCRWEPAILEAVEATEGKVLVDGDMKLITAAFHSNSGGETVGSETVWSGPLPYLTPRHDEFSLAGEHFQWERTIGRTNWLEYLKDKYRLDTDDELIRKMATNFNQERRNIFFLDPTFGIPLTEIRKDWQLNSTYFNIAPEGDSLVFEGRGFGHGTGLSQEGAMRMAKLGFTFEDILHFYYNDIHIIDLHALDFFRRE